MAEAIDFFDKLENRYLIKGKLVAQSSLHIGSGLGDKKTDARVMKIDGKPYVPGSTLKGLVRSNAERLVAALNDQQGFEATTCLLDKNYAQELGVDCATVDQDLMKKLNKFRKKDEQQYYNKLADNLCSVCQVFGSKEMASKVKVTDAFLSSDDFTTTIRDRIAVDRDTGTAKDGAKFDYEVVEKDAEFSFELIVENVTEAELGIVVLGLNDLIEGTAFIGGNNSQGLGKMKLELEEINYFANPADLMDYLKTGNLKEAEDAVQFLKGKMSQLFSGVN
ncbi:MAG: type III CRISPR-associated RAMP protein Csx7 [Bacillota bacterium]